MANITKIYKYELKIYKKPTKWSFEEDEFTKEEPEILAQNEKYVVLNDDYFTKLEKGGKSVCWSAINKPSIRFEDCLRQQGVFYSLYSTSKKHTTTIEAQIRNKAKEKYGWLFSDEMDLSILTGAK